MEDEKAGRLKVDFDIKGETVLALEYAKLESVGVDEKITEEDIWLAVFQKEDKGSQHFMGSHWEAFFDDADEVIKRLPEIIPQSRPSQACGDL